jgi:DNA repair ATPase RecN
MNTKRLIDLKTEIENLEKIHHVKILKILKNNEIKYSENRNGIFINMTSFNENTIKEIEKTLIYIKEQERNLKDIEAYKKELNKDYFINNHKLVKDNNTLNLNGNES